MDWNEASSHIGSIDTVNGRQRTLMNMKNIFASMGFNIIAQFYTILNKTMQLKE